MGLGERERARLVRTRNGEVGLQNGCCGEGGHEHPRVVGQLCPHRAGQPPSRAQRAPDVGERSHGVREEHDAEPRVDRVEVAAERLCLSVGGYEANVGDVSRRGPAGRSRDHRRRDVDADDIASGGHSGGQIHRARSRTASNIEHLLAGLEAEGIHGRHAIGVRERVDRVGPPLPRIGPPVPELLPLDPDLAHPHKT